MRRKVVIAIWIVLLAVSAVIRMVRVNISGNDLQPKITYQEMGQSWEMQDYTYCVQSYEILDADAMYERFAIRDEDTPKEDIYYLLADVAVTYSGEDEVRFDLMQFNFQSGGWHNGQDFFNVMKLNSEKMRLKKGETVTFTCITSLRRMMFSKSDWKKVKKRTYELVSMDYPDVVVVPLK